MTSDELEELVRAEVARQAAQFPLTTLDVDWLTFCVKMNLLENEGVQQLVDDT